MQKLEIRGQGEVIEVERGRKYRIKFKYQDPETKQWKYSPQRTIKGNKAKAKHELEKYKEEFAAKFNAPTGNSTLNSYIDDWQKTRHLSVKPQTISREAIQIKAIRRLLGETRMCNLTPSDIRKAMNKLAAEGKTKHAIHKFQMKLNQILTEAELDDVIAVNPCRKIREKVKPEETTRKSLSLAEAVSLAACLKSEPRDGCRVVVWLALALGLRRGELLGLQWRDVDWENCKICVQRQYNSRCELDEPKGGSKATISFDTGTKRFLLEWKVIQAQQYAEYGRTPTLETPICSPTVLVKDGRAVDYIEPTNFDRWRRHYFADHGLGKFTKIREVKTKRGEIETKYSGYEGYNLHELRHTQATLLIGNNVDLKTVQNRLRHSSASTTMGTYAHAIDANDELAAETIGELLNL